MMPIDPALLWNQVALGEDTDLEMKEVEFRGGRVSAPRRDPLADEIAAFGNAEGGRLVLGVTDETPRCTATTRCRDRAYACSCSRTAWSCTRPAACAIP